MKKILILCNCFWSFCASAQCLLVNINFNDCSTCRGAINAFNPDATGIPCYAIFPESSKPDSAEIEYNGKFQQYNIALIFNSVWTKKIHCEGNTSCVVGLDDKGKVVFQVPLTAKNDTAVKNFITKYAEKSGGNHEIKITSGAKYEFNSRLGKMAVSNAATDDLLYTINSSSVSLKSISEKLEGKEKLQLDKYGEYINHKMNGFDAKFFSFRIQNERLFMLFKYSSTPDSISENINDKYAMFVYDKSGKLQDVLPISMPDNIVFYEFNFMLAPDDNLYLYAYDLDSSIDAIKLTQKRKYITKLPLKNGSYFYEGWLDVDMPAIHKNKYNYNQLTAGYSEYPFLVNNLDNTITNLITKKSFNVINDSLYKSISSNKITDYSMNSERFRVLHLDKFATERTYYLTYKLNEEFYLLKFNENFTSTNTINLTSPFSSIKNISSISVHPNVNLISVRFGKNEDDLKEVILPLDLFIPK